MRGETTCPTCGGPCTVENTGPHWTTMRHPTLGTDVQIASGKLEYRTTADSARLARLESLLREIASWLAPEGTPEQLWFGAFRDWQKRAKAALLGPADAS